jgi:hypothetical protein
MHRYGHFGTHFEESEGFQNLSVSASSGGESTTGKRSLRGHSKALDGKVQHRGRLTNGGGGRFWKHFMGQNKIFGKLMLHANKKKGTNILIDRG